MSSIEAIGRGWRRVDVRLALSLTVLYAPLVATLLLVLYVFAADELLELLDARATKQLDVISRLLSGPPSTTRNVNLAELETLMSDEGLSFLVRNPQGSVILGRNAAPSEIPIPAAGRSPFDAVLLSGGERLLYRRQLASGDSLELTADVRTFVTERDEVQRGFWITLALGLIGAGATSIVAARIALAPLRQATRATEAVDLHRLDARLPVRGTQDDVDRHAAAVNRVLDRLERGFARISAFSQDVAHELRTPVNRILNGAEVAILDTADTATAQATLEMIRDSAEQMTRVIDGLLMLARDADGRLHLDAAPLPLSELFETLAEMYGPACEERGLRLETSAAHGTIQADRTLLVRAISNLLDNALRHTPPGGSIRVEASWRGPTLTIEVADTGAGIPESERERVFSRFVRLGTARDGSAGLGLPIARMIARAHGGDLVAGRSALGGAVFSLRLPAGGAGGPLQKNVC